MKTKDQVQEIFGQIWQEINKLREAGQKEYAGGENAFGNFERLATELNLTREKVLWVYFTKHLDGIRAYLNGHVSQRESIEGRINDAIVYLMLLRCMVQDSKESLLSPSLLQNDNSWINRTGKLKNKLK